MLIVIPVHKQVEIWEIYYHVIAIDGTKVVVDNNYVGDTKPIEYLRDRWSFKFEE
jgi:hypothetical protein